MPRRNGRQTLRFREAVGSDATLGTQKFSAPEDGIDLIVRVCVVEIGVVSKDGNSEIGGFLSDLCVVILRRMKTPFPKLLPRLLCADTGRGEAWFDPCRMEFHYTHAVLHQPIEQDGPVLRRHGEVVIAKWL